MPKRLVFFHRIESSSFKKTETMLTAAKDSERSNLDVAGHVLDSRHMLFE